MQKIATGQIDERETKLKHGPAIRRAQVFEITN